MTPEAAVLMVAPSPKSQKRLVIVPLELSVKETLSGLRPVVGLPVKFAVGASAPEPVRVLVLLPPLPVVTISLFVKLAALVGAKRTTRLVPPKPGKAKGVPETIVNGPPLTVATPLVSAAPPRLVTTKLAWVLAPTATMPKSSLGGATASWAGVRPAPVTLLLLLPPLLVKTTRLLKAAALVGLKLTATKPVWPGVRLKGLPLWMVKGSVVAALPLRVGPPVLTSWKLCVLVWPITSGSKFRLGGLSDNCGGRLVTRM